MLEGIINESFEHIRLRPMDETGSDNHTYLIKYGYASKGVRPKSHQRLYHDERISAIAALSTDGLVCAEVRKQILVHFIILLGEALFPT